MYHVAYCYIYKLCKTYALHRLIDDGYSYNQHEIGTYIILLVTYMIFLVTYIDNFYVYVILISNSYLKMVIQMFHVAYCYNHQLCKNWCTYIHA